MKHNLFRIGIFVMGAFCAIGNAYAVSMLWCMDAADYFVRYNGTCAEFAEENGTELDTTQLSRCNALRNAIMQAWYTYYGNGIEPTPERLLEIKKAVLSNETWKDFCYGCNQYIECGTGTWENVSNEPGKQRRSVGTCDLTFYQCNYSYEYRCVNGYFGDGDTCTSCAVATGVDGATTVSDTSITSITQCFLRAGNHKDATGDFTLSNTCYYSL
ncbi:MAG: hypothetical protein J6L70_00775 [Alphaproteobacteria bacterium]|nr:hypothetical protein [Alphaproteobacteria bacterium]